MRRGLRLLGPTLLGALFVLPALAQPAPPPDAPAPFRPEAFEPEPAPAPPPDAPAPFRPEAFEPEPAPPAPPPREPVVPPSTPAAVPPRRILEQKRDLDRESSERDFVRKRGDFGVELGLGMNVRLAGASGFDQEETLGVAYGGALWLNLLEQASLGLELQYAGLGQGSAQDGLNLAQVEFSTTTAWLSGRLWIFRLRRVDGFVALRAGLALQHVGADGVRQRGSALEPPRSFSCDETTGPGMAVGGGVGARWGLGPRLSFVTRLDGNAQKLSGDAIGGCTVGVGSTTSLSLGLALAYELGGSDSRAALAARARSQP